MGLRGKNTGVRQEPVLIVEDSEDIRDLLVYRLERDGFSIVTAADGDEAMRPTPRWPAPMF